ncbi:MAG: phosphatidylinositol-specific phospholipase [Deltaproteobacteria bacterium]|nr:phosphatidylinositol-specific phospholipase [Deltaproteobacteria bacterium]
MNWFVPTAIGLALAACTDASGPPVAPAWMSKIDDGRLLSELSIPGTHESASLYEVIPGSSRDQTLTLDQQLDAGVRYFDIRCRHLGDGFDLYHGPLFERQTFAQVVETFSAFLDSHPTEAAVMSIKEESVADNTMLTFEQVFATYVALDPARWYLGGAVPALGDVRGKIVLVRRFVAETSPLGLDASDWPDNATFSITTPQASLRVQDAFKVTSNESKWMAIEALLAEARDAGPSTLFLNYTSGFQTLSGIPNTPSVAMEINLDLDAFLADPANAHAHLGVLAMDLVEKSRVAAVAATNQP